MKLELSELVDSLPGLVWTALPDGQAEFINRRWCEYTGLTPSQAIGSGWQSSIHPDDLAPVLEHWRSFLSSGRPGEIQARLRRYDGEYRRFLICAAPVMDKSGANVKWCGINTDVEDRLKAQEALRDHAADALRASEGELRRTLAHLVEAQRLSKSGSYIADLLADEHSWSDEFYRICEFEIGTPITTATLQSIVHPDDLTQFQGAIARAMEGTDPDFVFRIVTASGTMKHLRGIAHRVHDDTTRPIFVGAVQDITETVLAEGALTTARTELAHVARVLTLGALTASIAHEVNQPLSGIITNAATCLRMLAADPPNVEGARATAQRTLRDGNRASEVIRRLRSMFSGKQPTSESVDLNEAAQEVLSLSSGELRSIRATLTTDFEAGLPSIKGDRVQLQQVILNLILNAADAMRGIHNGPRTLLIATAREDARRVQLSVRDSGVGIDPQNLERLFDAFYTTKSHGMGVGLSISRTIIENHRGHFKVTPNEGPGATFTFSIPCSEHGSG